MKRAGVFAAGGVVAAILAAGAFGPAGAAVATIDDLAVGYNGRMFSNDEGGRQNVQVGFSRGDVTGNNFEATINTVIPVGMELGASGLTPIPFQGAVSSKGKFGGTGDLGGGVKLKLKGTLSAGGAAILGTYAFTQGKQKLESGQFYLEDD
jgi:hypothetical protein